MFKILGIIVGLYTLYAVVTGQVIARSGALGKRYFRDETPRTFWTVIVVYTLLTIALLTVF